MNELLYYLKTKIFNLNKNICFQNKIFILKLFAFQNLKQIQTQNAKLNLLFKRLQNFNGKERTVIKCTTTATTTATTTTTTTSV